MAQAIELTLRIEGRHLTVLRLQEAAGAAAGAAPAEAAIDLDSRALLDWIVSLTTHLPPQRVCAMPPPPAFEGGRSVYHRIAIAIILRMTQSMLTDPCEALGRVRAEQVFGMLQLADLLNLDEDVCQFLAHHHAALLRGLRGDLPLS